MTTDPFDAYPKFPRWARLLVAGDPLTREQTNEVMVRTTMLRMLECDDPEWNADLVDAYQIHPSENLHRPDIPDEVRRAAVHATGKRWDRREKALGVLNLTLLDNRRIASRWVEGPHGWCDWDGRIYTDEYAVGPEAQTWDVHWDAERIASAFPFLRMRVQLLPLRWLPEHDCNGNYVADQLAPVTWTIADGNATYDLTPQPPIATGAGPDWIPAPRYGPYGQRGTTIERVREALAQVEGAATPGERAALGS